MALPAQSQLLPSEIKKYPLQRTVCKFSWSQKEDLVKSSTKIAQYKCHPSVHDLCQ